MENDMTLTPKELKRVQRVDQVIAEDAESRSKGLVVSSIAIWPPANSDAEVSDNAVLHVRLEEYDRGDYDGKGFQVIYMQGAIEPDGFDEESVPEQYRHMLGMYVSVTVETEFTNTVPPCYAEAAAKHANRK